MATELTDAIVEQMVRYPIPEVERTRLEASIDTKPAKPRAFVLGHGLWNDLDMKQSLAWLDSVLGTIHAQTGDGAGWRGRHDGGGGPRQPVLLVTPNAAGEKKPDEWIISQGNKALVRFEKAMAAEAGRRQIDHLGTWNMSIQATLYDGVHMDVRGNLVKAMMVLNWLNLVGT